MKILKLIQNKMSPINSPERIQPSSSKEIKEIIDQHRANLAPGQGIEIAASKDNGIEISNKMRSGIDDLTDKKDQEKLINLITHGLAGVLEQDDKEELSVIITDWIRNTDMNFSENHDKELNIKMRNFMNKIKIEPVKAKIGKIDENFRKFSKYSSSIDADNNDLAEMKKILDKDEIISGSDIDVEITNILAKTKDKGALDMQKIKFLAKRIPGIMNPYGLEGSNLLLQNKSLNEKEQAEFDKNSLNLQQLETKKEFEETQRALANSSWQKLIKLFTKFFKK